MAGFIRGLRALFGNRIGMIEGLAAGIPRIGRADFGRINAVLVNVPELVADVLIEHVEDYQKGPVLRIISRPVLGDGLLTSEGDQHRQRRKLVAPAFAHQRVSRYAAVMTDDTKELIAGWRDGQEMDVAQAMMRLTLGIVGKTLFDVNLLDQADSLGQDITHVQHSADRQMRVPFKLPFQFAAEAALKRLNETLYRIIRERRASGADKGDLLSMLLMSTDEETGRHLTDQETRDEAMTLFLAGHETTAQALSWAWYLLALNPQYFKRLREEGMPFALQVMKESMRLYPPAFILARSALRDTMIGDFQVKKDDLVFIAPWLFHRDPRLFDDPLRFDPDRFLPEREAKLPRFAYMPFGGGRRICIGNQFALMEGQIILNTIAQSFEMELLSTKPIECQPFITLRPKGGVKVRVRKLATMPV
jgi:cytochrome P450